MNGLHPQKNLGGWLDGLLDDNRILVCIRSLVQSALPNGRRVDAIHFGFEGFYIEPFPGLSPAHDSAGAMGGRKIPGLIGIALTDQESDLHVERQDEPLVLV